VIGKEARSQILKTAKRLPDYLIACVGGGSNSMGFFYPFLKDQGVRMIGIEAAGEGVGTYHHAASITKGRPGILHGMKSYLLQDQDGQVLLAHSISAGLDYPSVGPEHSYLKDSGRVSYQAVTDRDALKGFEMLTKLEGIMPALEPAHAVGYLPKLMSKTKKSDIVILCLSGRGDKDMKTVQGHLKV
jgi:tryptophan synthase beta chain